MLGFRTSLEKKKDATGDRVVITLDGKVGHAVESELMAVLAVLDCGSMGYVGIEVKNESLGA